MRLLFVKLGSIGDIVHALPALAALRRALPQEWRISWAVEHRAAEILRDNPFLDDLIEVDTKELRRAPSFGETLPAARRQLQRLRAQPFDLAIDFQGLIKSALVAKLARAPRRVGFALEALREPLSRFLLTETVSVPPQIHVIRKNLTLAARALNLELSQDANAFEFPIATNEAHEAEADELIRAHVENYARGFAILNPGGNWATKLWDAERFGALADLIWRKHNLRSLVTFGPGEAELAARVVKASRAVVNHQRDERVAVAASLSLKGFYALARRAKIYVGGDTGPTHIAVAACAPIVGLYGPTEWRRNGSPREEDICVERTDISCRANCHRRTCDKWICMDIETARTFDAVTERLQRAQMPDAKRRTETLLASGV